MSSISGNTTGSFNTAIGAGALLVNTADNNTASGTGALLNNTTGGFNTASGAFALFGNTEGNDNTASGFQALFSNTIGDVNTATGLGALYHNMTGNSNTANGAGALTNNYTGDANSALGADALWRNRGSYNTAEGFQALYNNEGALGNTANGYQALWSNYLGSYNTAQGFKALYQNATASANTAIGYLALFGNMDGSNNIAVGAGAGFYTTGYFNINIGNPGVGSESRTVRIGTGDGEHTRMFLAGVRGVTTGQANAIPVVIDGAAQLGTQSSSRRYKKDIKRMDRTSEAVLALKPVTFHYKSDKTNTSQFGLIAEEVADVNPDLVVRDDKGEIYTVRYDAVNAMLLNEFLKEHRAFVEECHKVEQQNRKIQEQEAMITQLNKGMAAVVVRLEEQDSKIQKVSDQLETAKASRQVVLNNEK